MGVNRRLDQVVCDTSLTNTIDLTNQSLNHGNHSNTNEICRRFSTYILPRIHCNVVNLCVEGWMYHQIFGSINYPNLRKITFDNIEVDMVRRIFKSTLLVRLTSE